MNVSFFQSRSSFLAPRTLFRSFTALLLAIASSPLISAEQTRPNIVLIVADDLGYGELGCYGQQLIKTPRLDQLAKEGARFTNFYCGAPVCAPSRCTLMTGKHLGHAAIRNNKATPNQYPELREKYGWDSPGQQPLPVDEITIAELLHAQGYATGAMGKWGLGMPGTTGDPNRQGFDLFYGFMCQSHAHNHYPTFLWRNDKKKPLPGNDGTATGATFSQDKFVEEAERFIRSHREQPFFLYLPFTIPHLSLQVPEASLQQYAGKFTEESYKHGDAYFPHPTPRAAYAAMISHMDAGVGKIIDLIGELELADNTLILFTSDNGPTYSRLGGSDSAFFHSAGPLRGLKGSAYDGGIRVPLIARWPGKIPAGRESDHVAAFWDMLPTLCEIARVEIPKGLDGISLAPTLFENGTQPDHEYLYWEFPAYEQQQAVRSGNWKIIRSGVGSGDPPYELYDLNEDIGEQHNVATEHPDVVDRLAAFAKAAHTPSKMFPLLASEKPPGAKRKPRKSAKAAE